MNVSALVLTLNEERALPRCLESLGWCDDVVVLDSGSTDLTVDVARSFGCRVFERRFDDWASHQNWAVQNIRFEHPWVYYSDADEVVTKSLAEEIGNTLVKYNDEIVGYRVRFKLIFYDKWIRFASLYPTWVLRLFKPDRIRWERLVNPVPIVDGRVGRLQEHFLHYSFDKGLEDWFRRHNLYSSSEAIELVKARKEGLGELGKIVSVDPADRRQALKRISFFLPFRPGLRFLYMYFFRLGILDGRRGLTYCSLMAMYESLISLKAEEILSCERAIHP